MAVKVTNSQTRDGTISKITCHEEYYLCGKFHGFMKKYTILPILGAMPLAILFCWGVCSGTKLIYDMPGAILSYDTVYVVD